MEKQTPRTNQSQLNAAYVNGLINGLNRVLKDKERRIREARQLCLTCHYLSESLIHAPLTLACLNCEKPLLNGHALCESCAEKHDGCTRCGAFMKDEPARPPKEDWLERLMENHRYEQQWMRDQLMKRVHLFHADALYAYRSRRRICKTCFYIDEYHKKSGKLLTHNRCQGCTDAVATLKHVPKSLCDPCGERHDACVYCSQDMD